MWRWNLAQTSLDATNNRQLCSLFSLSLINDHTSFLSRASTTHRPLRPLILPHTPHKPSFIDSLPTIEQIFIKIFSYAITIPHLYSAPVLSEGAMRLLLQSCWIILCKCISAHAAISFCIVSHGKQHPNPGKYVNPCSLVFLLHPCSLKQMSRQVRQ